jgi:hypothetical protein
MSRLLFAAARGARIQSRWVKGTQWQTTGQFVFVDGMRYYRIHPDDEHLQYGPISTEVRNIRLTDLQLPHLALASACVCGLDGTWSKDWRNQTTNERATAMLILAEALADEGM